jgi:hypothetical protein
MITGGLGPHDQPMSAGDEPETARDCQIFRLRMLYVSSGRWNPLNDISPMHSASTIGSTAL